MEDLVFYGVLGLAVCAGALFARFFPRLGIVLGWTILAGTAIAFFGIAYEAVKTLGVFYGFLLSAIAAMLALVPIGIASGLLAMGKRVLEAQEVTRQTPVAVAGESFSGPSLTPDIEAYIRAHYPGTRAEAARELVAGARIRGGELPGSRLVRCALVASGGDLEGLREQVRRMRTDHNDLIQRAECEVDPAGHYVRVRDLSRPFDAKAPVRLARHRAGERV